MILFAWDFHGVLEKGNEQSVIDISNAVLQQQGFQERFTDSDNETYYGLKWYEYFEKLLPGLPHQKHLELQHMCFSYAEEHKEILAKNIHPNDNALNVLEQIQSSGNHQLVISNTRQDDLYWFVDTIRARSFFADDRIIGVNAHQTHNSKLDAMKAYLETHSYQKIVAIGDSTSDLQLGKALGAVTYFYKHPHRIHEDTHLADHVTTDLRLVLQEL